MRRPLGALPVLVTLTALLLGGCGDDAVERAGDESGSAAPSATTDPDGSSAPTPTPTPTPTSAPSDGDAPEPVDHEVVALPYATAADGTVSPMLTPIDSPAELDTFVSQFRREELAEEVRTIARTASYDGELWAAVVSVGCDVPSGVLVTEGEAGYLVRAQKVVDPLDNCVAPVTTVALVAIR